MSNSFNEVLARIKAAKAAKEAATQAALKATLPEPPPQNIEPEIQHPPRADNTILDKYGNLITLNAKQQEFVTLAGKEGKSGVLIGAAGTGKTTTQKAVCQALILNGRAGILDAEDHKHLSSGTPGILICAYTRRAVANIKRNLPEDLQSNAITFHAALEYKPEYYEVMDPKTGESKTTMRFVPSRNEFNPLPQSIQVVIVEEASMLGVDLFKQFINALSHPVQFIFLGDIQQLPPVFGPAILGFKLLSLPSVELTEVYRQALESPIISLAHRILSAKPIQESEFSQWKFPGQLTLHPWKKKISAEVALKTLGGFFKAAADNGSYDPEEDMILLPFNKACGTEELNKIIADHLAHKRGAIVWQIVSGYNKIHLSVGDKVLYDKEDAVVIDIKRNSVYSGAQPVPESTTLDYWGFDSESHVNIQEKTDEDVDFILSQVATAANAGEERVRQASHIITLKMLDSEQEIRLDKAAELNALLLGYSLTVHKSQGSEWRKVFFCVHQSHATMIQRELLYTAVTRAREELYVICEPDTFVKGVLAQRVKGNTLAEKAEYFKGKIDEGFTLDC